MSVQARVKYNLQFLDYMRKLEAAEMENWTFEGLPGTVYYAVDEDLGPVRLLLSALEVDSVVNNPAYVFIVNVPVNGKSAWHICPWLSDAMVDVLLRVAPPSVALRRAKATPA